MSVSTVAFVFVIRCVCAWRAERKLQIPEWGFVCQICEGNCTASAQMWPEICEY